MSFLEPIRTNVDPDVSLSLPSDSCAFFYSPPALPDDGSSREPLVVTIKEDHFVSSSLPSDIGSNDQNTATVADNNTSTEEIHR